LLYIVVYNTQYILLKVAYGFCNKTRPVFMSVICTGFNRAWSQWLRDATHCMDVTGRPHSSKWILSSLVAVTQMIENEKQRIYISW